MVQEEYTSISVPVSLRDEILKKKHELEKQFGVKISNVEYLRKMLNLQESEMMEENPLFQMRTGNHSPAVVA